ncbi:conserved protein of unknown function [Ralstonia solanacearum CMR15]|nr:conserved protein of unknown function [Ralstonia solanacearum CMR15]
MTTNPWQVQIQGYASDLEHLTGHLSSTMRRVLRDEHGVGFLYESSAFATCNQAQEVLAVANEELRVLSGVLKVTRDSPEPLSTGAVFKKNAAGGRDVFVFIVDGVQARCELGEIVVADSNGSVIAGPTRPSKTTTVAQLALGDAAVGKVMRLLAAPDCNSWVGMYRIYEVIEADIGGQHKLEKAGWGAAKDLDRFKHSANSVTVAGDSARHGKEKARPPANPMSLDEADAYLWHLLRSWLSSKGI